MDSVGSGVEMDATTPNNVGTCSALYHNIDKLKEFAQLYCDTSEWSSRRPCVMHVCGPNNVGRAVQTDLTSLRYASAIKEQKKCWE